MMKGCAGRLLQARVRRAFRESGFDLPEGPALPPRDVIDRALRSMGVAASGLAVALGVEAGLTVCESTVPVASRSRAAIRREMTWMLLSVVVTATELGLEVGDLLGDALACAEGMDAGLRGDLERRHDLEQMAKVVRG